MHLNVYFKILNVLFMNSLSVRNTKYGILQLMLVNNVMLINNVMTYNGILNTFLLLMQLKTCYITCTNNTMFAIRFEEGYIMPSSF